MSQNIINISIVDLTIFTITHNIIFPPYVNTILVRITIMKT